MSKSVRFSAAKHIISYPKCNPVVNFNETSIRLAKLPSKKAIPLGPAEYLSKKIVHDALIDFFSRQALVEDLREAQPKPKEHFGRGCDLGDREMVDLNRNKDQTDYEIMLKGLLKFEFIDDDSSVSF